MSTPWPSDDEPRGPSHAGLSVWRVAVPDAGPVLDALHAVLSEHEKKRASEKRIDDKRREYITGQAVLRLFLARATGTEESAICYARGPKGKPYLGGMLEGHPLQFNISHSGGEVMLALARDVEVGVDLERINDRTDCARVARRAFSERERDALPDPATNHGRRHFFALWTAKEAVVKCTGDGIHSGLRRFSVELAAEGGARISEAHSNQRKVAGLSIVPLPVEPPMVATLVHSGPALELALHRIDPARLVSGALRRTAST